MHPWRLLIDGTGPGAWNMAVDEILLRRSAADGGPPTLRFYGWSEPTLSLGYFQPYDHPRLHAANRVCDVVRRASGGGAILHHHDLTYSLALPVVDRWSNTADKLYRHVREALIVVLHSWGVAPSTEGTGPQGVRSHSGVSSAAAAGTWSATEPRSPAALNGGPGGRLSSTAVCC
jgi:lipoate-protein ligase A